MRLALLAALALAVQAAPAQTVLYPGLSGRPLLDSIRADYGGRAVGYGPARDSLYAYEQRTHGAVCGVYTAFCVEVEPGADPSTSAYEQGVNAEHVWPQSYGASGEPLKSDLHHVVPARADVNSARSNHPYGEVPDGEADAWFRGAERRDVPPSVEAGAWSEKDDEHPDPAFGGRFEPRHDRKGDVARAALYVRALYPEATSGAAAFFEAQRADLLAWHAADPVDGREAGRSAWIARLQGAPNPFVLDSTLARRAFGGPGGGGEAAPDVAPDDVPVVWVNEVHYDNEGADVGEGAEIAGPAGVDLAGWSLALYNGADGALYQTVILDGVLPDQENGFGAVWVEVAGLQNGSPDGLALVAPGGSVVEFLSYEGAFTAVDGPAAGRASTDIGVAEAPATPPGYSVQRGGTGDRPERFAWSGPISASPGRPNTRQTLRSTPTVLPERPEMAVDVAVAPNPAREVAEVSVQLAASEAVRVEVLDALGRQVAVLWDGLAAPGPLALPLDASGLRPGVYRVRVVVGVDVEVLPVTVVR